jgi:hypothetical protein
VNLHRGKLSDWVRIGNLSETTLSDYRPTDEEQNSRDHNDQDLEATHVPRPTKAKEHELASKSWTDKNDLESKHGMHFGS